MVSRVISPQIKLRCNLSSGERTEPRRKRVAVAVICVALQRKTEMGWSPNKHKPSHSTAGGWFIQKNKIHPANRSQDKEISVNGSSLAFPEVSLWKEPVEHSGALCCTDYKRLLFRSTWVVVPFSLERFKRLHVIKLNTAVPNCNDQTSFLSYQCCKKRIMFQLPEASFWVWIKVLVLLQAPMIKLGFIRSVRNISLDVDFI